MTIKKMRALLLTLCIVFSVMSPVAFAVQASEEANTSNTAKDRLNAKYMLVVLCRHLLVSRSKYASRYGGGSSSKEPSPSRRYPGEAGTVNTPETSIVSP